MVEKNIKITIESQMEKCTELLIEVNETIAKTILENTKCPKDRIDSYFSNNTSHYTISNLSDEELADIITTAENIANNLETNEFISTILTNNGRDMMPAKMHEMMQTKYGLKDNVEWFVALIFVNLGGLITQPEFCYRSMQEDMESDDCIVITVSN